MSVTPGGLGVVGSNPAAPTIYPVLRFSDCEAGIAFLVAAFGFTGNGVGPTHLGREDRRTHHSALRRSQPTSPALILSPVTLSPAVNTRPDPESLNTLDLTLSG